MECKHIPDIQHQPSVLIVPPPPRKQETLTNAGMILETLAQYHTSIGSTSPVCWELPPDANAVKHQIAITVPSSELWTSHWALDVVAKLNQRQ